MPDPFARQPAAPPARGGYGAAPAAAAPQAEQAELVMRQTHATRTAWGISIDPRLRLKPAQPGYPAHDSAEYKLLEGWTLIGVNGTPVRTYNAASQVLGVMAEPGAELTLHCRSPMPGDDAPAAAVAGMAGKGMAAGGKGGKTIRGTERAACYTCGTPGHSNRDCERWHMNKRIQAQQEAQKDLAPCHPIGMSRAEAEADILVSQLEEQQAKRPRAEGAPASPLEALQQRREDLRETKEELTKCRLENETLRQKCADQERLLQDHQRQLQMVGEEQHISIEKQLEKIKSRLDKIRAAEKDRQQHEADLREGALSKGISGASDEELTSISELRDATGAPAQLTPDYGWKLLGLERGSGVGSAQAKSQELVGSYDPESVSLEVCKEGLRRRVSLAQRALHAVGGT